MKQSFEAIVRGRVQGVGFRWSVRREAERVGAVGWVCNMPDGTVAARVQGDAAQLDHMRRFLSEGPALSRVEDVAISDIDDGESFAQFEIRQEPPR